MGRPNAVIISGDARGPARQGERPAAAAHPAVALTPGDITVRKTRVGAFSTTDLDE
jgi:hypothetical protein